jgi:hypothetical protein
MVPLRTRVLLSLYLGAWVSGCFVDFPKTQTVDTVFDSTHDSATEDLPDTESSPGTQAATDDTDTVSDPGTVSDTGSISDTGVSPDSISIPDTGSTADSETTPNEGVVIYEPFDYPAGHLNLQSGASEVGLAGSWNALSTDGQALVIGSSLSHGSLPTKGGSIGGLECCINRFGGSRAVRASALLGNGLLQDGATLWFSVVVGFGLDPDGVPGNIANAHLVLALANSSFSEGRYEYWIKDEDTHLGSGLGLTLGLIDGKLGSVVATQFRDLASGDFFNGNIRGDITGASYTENQHGLIVGKIEWGAVQDTLVLYQPDKQLNMGSPVSTLTVSVDQSTYDTITFARGDVIVMDEIRFGTSYDAVIGAEDP